MTFSRVKPSGWATGERLTSTQMNNLDIDHARAVDGNAGGSYTPSSAIVIGGSGLQVGGVGTGVAERLLALEDPPFLRATLTGSGLSSDAKLTPAEEISKGTWSIASNDVQVPQAGWYLVTVNCLLTSTNTANPYLGQAYVSQAGSGGIVQIRTIRWSATNTDAFPASFSGLAKITTPSTEKLSIHVAGAGTIAVSALSDGNQVHIAYLGEI